MICAFCRPRRQSKLQWTAASLACVTVRAKWFKQKPQIFLLWRKSYCRSTLSISVCENCVEDFDPAPAYVISDADARACHVISDAYLWYNINPYGVIVNKAWTLLPHRSIKDSWFALCRPHCTNPAIIGYVRVLCVACVRGLCAHFSFCGLSTEALGPGFTLCVVVLRNIFQFLVILVI